MDGSCRNQSASCGGRPAGCQPLRPGQQAGISPAGPACFCTGTAPGALEQYPVGMGYVPWQQWQQLYSPEQGLQKGTLFPDLDLPFMRGGCRR